MCIRHISTYPCGHTKSHYTICAKAKTTSMLRLGPKQCTDTLVTKREPPNLQETCGSTCLTKPYQCKTCGSEKELTWHCQKCGTLRANSVTVWNVCTCPKHICGEAVLGRPFCKSCREKCVPAGPMITWKCHACGKAVRSYPNERECGKCLHVRCRECTPLP
ncbi:hypothetical protein GGS20DRAFT_528128 [Poronia punctata]|nr:hypothetical protein GGS20DRAFT_528128 [Poronia punctata]